MKLIHIKPSTLAKKKYMALFEMDNGRPKTVHFGQAGAPDYTLTGDEDKKKLYLLRHRARENWDKPDTAGALSRWILWNKPTISASVADYKRRFNF